jgi:homoserine kinase
MKWIKIFSPATIGNIGPGFDVLGMAVKGIGDIVAARRIDSGVVISEIEPNYNISYSADKNTAGIAAKEVLKMLGIENKAGIELKVFKGLPIGSGLGSSAASAAAGAYAANYLYGGKLSNNELILAATMAEEYVSGGFFADNTAAAILGGVTIAKSCKPVDVAKLGVIKELKIIIVMPDLVILTKKARDVLPEKIAMKDFVYNMCNSCLITAAFAKGDYKLLVKGLNDVVVEPVRASLIPGFQFIKQNAMKAGADGVSISGAGPAIFAITNDEFKVEKIQEAMVAGFRELNIKCKSFVTDIDDEGTRIIS